MVVSSDMILTRENLGRTDFLEGCLILIDKPERWTSFDVVNKLRATLRRTFGYGKIKVGHGGTLDPMATGLLIVGTGKMTKKLGQVQIDGKGYTGTMMLGATTASFDSETPVDMQYPVDHIDRELLETTRLRFIGKISQVPPVYSAIKKGGVPLYKKARKGQVVLPEPRMVEIFEFEILEFEKPRVQFEVLCSKGTYIRSLVHDFGQALNSGAFLEALNRTSSGSFLLKDAWQLTDLIRTLEELKPGSHVD